MIEQHESPVAEVLVHITSGQYKNHVDSNELRGIFTDH